MILSDALIATAAKNLQRPAVRYLGKEVSYADLKSRVGRLSYLFQKEIGHGARVAFIARNSPEWIISFLAITNIQSIPVPVDPECTDDEIISWLREVRATHVLVSEDLLGRVRDVLRRAGLNLPVVEFERKKGGEYDPVYKPPAEHTPKETDVAAIFRSAGTIGHEGKCKLVKLNHKQLQFAATSLKRPYHLNPSDRFLTTQSWAHPFAFLHGILFPILSGATAVVDHGLQNLEFLDFLIENRITRLVDHPKFFYRLLVICKNEKRTLPGIKSVVIGRGRTLTDVAKVFALMKIPCLPVYGLSEIGWTVAMGDRETVPLPEDGVKGVGLPGFQYKVVDTNGDEVEGEDEREGQLAVTGPAVMTGYDHPDEKMATAISKTALRGTWLYTGDIVRLKGPRESPEITFLGRKEDLYFHEGRYYSPEIYDRALKGAPGVEDAAGFVVVGSGGAKGMGCAVVRVEGMAVTESGLLERLSAQFSGAEVPIALVFTDSIPKDRVGIVKRSALRARFSGMI